MTKNKKKVRKTPILIFLSIFFLVVVMGCLALAYVRSPRYAVRTYIRDTESYTISSENRFPHTMTLFYDRMSCKITSCDVYGEYAFASVEVTRPDLYAMMKSAFAELLTIPSGSSNVEVDYLYEFERIMSEKFSEEYVPVVTESFETKLYKDAETKKWSVDESWTPAFASSLVGNTDDLSDIFK